MQQYDNRKDKLKRPLTIFMTYYHLRNQCSRPAAKNFQPV